MGNSELYRNKILHFRTITVGEGSSWSMLLLGVGISGWLSSLEVGGKLLGTSNFLWLEKLAQWFLQLLPSLLFQNLSLYPGIDLS